MGTKSPEPEPEPTAQLAEEGVPPSAVALVPVDDPASDLTEEMARLRQLADAPVTPSPSTFTPGAHMVSPTIAGSPALSGVLANTEGLSAFEQILRLREVRHPPASVSASLHARCALTRPGSAGPGVDARGGEAGCRDRTGAAGGAAGERPRPDSGGVPPRYQPRAPPAKPRVSKPPRACAGTEQGKEIVEALVSQSRENLRQKMSDYSKRKSAWEKRLAMIQVRRHSSHSSRFASLASDLFPRRRATCRPR